MSLLRLVAGRRGVAIVAAMSAAAALAVPASASTIAGGGTLSGLVTFGTGSVPTVLQNCGAVGWHFDSSQGAPPYNGLTTAAVLDIQGETYAGGVHISGDGSSPSECTSQGGGTLVVNVAGTAANGATLSCGPLHGIYERVAAIVTIYVSGPCTLDNHGGTVQLIAGGDLNPTSGDGVFTPISAADFAGSWFGVVPS